MQPQGTKPTWKNIANHISKTDGNKVSAERCRQIARLAFKKLQNHFRKDPYISEYFRSQGFEFEHPDNKDPH